MAKTDSSGAGPRRLFLLDGHSLAYRAFFALPVSLATSTGQVTNAVYGFTSMLIKILSEERPEMIAVVFDVGAPTVRLEMDSDYKAGRPETPDDLSPQFGLIKEVLETIKVPVLGVPDHEADDVIGTLAVQAAEHGIDATIVTADRDFFQLVRPGVSVMFNRKGISDVAIYDPAAVEERYGVKPEQYIDLAALRGDKSDNIPGVPGVGEKTAAKLITEYGTVESVLEHSGQLKGKLKENIEASADRLALNKNLVRIVTDIDLGFGPLDCVMGDRDPEDVRRLFWSLEFRTLLDRLEQIPVGGWSGDGSAPVVASVAEGTDSEAAPAAADLEQVSPDALAAAFSKSSDEVAVRARVSGGVAVGMSISDGERGSYAPLTAGLSDAGLSALLEKGARPVLTHDSKSLHRAVVEAGGREASSLSFDTMLGAYLDDPASADYSLDDLCRRHLGEDLVAGATHQDQPAQAGLFEEDDWRAHAIEAVAVARLAPVLRAKLAASGLGDLLRDVELPLSAVLARMEARGIKLDVPYLEAMGSDVRAKMSELQAQVHELAGEEFNLNSPVQLRTILYDKLGLKPGRKTAKGDRSTDASVLEKLRDEHPLVPALLSWRELGKLNSTYIEALPRLVDPRDGRIHTTFNQTVAATGRLSSSNPNLQNIPVRSSLGREIRRAFIAESPETVLLVADYSQIELRILAHLSGDEGLREAFATGQDIHVATAARVFGLPIDHVDVESRRRAKAVNYGLAYGMNAWGLSSRLGIAPDEAQSFIDAYFASFPKIREYLDKQVAFATTEGYTETLLGRRRYVPELRAANPRIRDLGRRQALNAPIQGSASDVFKQAMIAVDRALDAKPELGCRMLLTVHDELVFEVPKENVEAVAAVVSERMENATVLDVPMTADIGWAGDWASAAPEGH